MKKTSRDRRARASAAIGEFSPRARRLHTRCTHHLESPVFARVSGWASDSQSTAGGVS